MLVPCFSSSLPTSRTTQPQRFPCTSTATKDAVAVCIRLKHPAQSLAHTGRPSCLDAFGETRRGCGSGDALRACVAAPSHAGDSGRNTMTSSSAESDDTPAIDSNWSDNPVNAGECLPESRERTWLEEIALQLETNPHECWQAIESLAQIEPEVRPIDHRRVIRHRVSSWRHQVTPAAVFGPRSRDPLGRATALERIHWRQRGFPRSRRHHDSSK